MNEAAITLLVIFTTIASIDGFYFHIYRYRLYARPECEREHLLHTINAVLFPFTLAPFFLAQVSGAWLWVGALAAGLTLLIEGLDVFSEHDSRAQLGGLTPTEYLMHFMMSGLRWGSMALAIAAVPVSAWWSSTEWHWLPPLSSPDAFVVWCIVAVSGPVAALHVLLATRGAGRSIAESALRLRPLLAT